MDRHWWKWAMLKFQCVIRPDASMIPRIPVVSFLSNTFYAHRMASERSDSRSPAKKELPAAPPGCFQARWHPNISPSGYSKEPRYPTNKYEPKGILAMDMYGYLWINNLVPYACVMLFLDIGDSEKNSPISFPNLPFILGAPTIWPNPLRSPPSQPWTVLVPYRRRPTHSPLARGGCEIP